MSNYNFQGSLYRTNREMHRAACEAWLTAGGMNNRQIIIEDILPSETDAQLTDSMFDAWNLDNDEEQDWDRDLAWEIFTELRAEYFESQNNHEFLEAQND